MTSEFWPTSEGSEASATPSNQPLPPLTDCPPFAGFFSREDSHWKARLIQRVLRGQITLPRIEAECPTKVQARHAIDEVTHRVYHVARVMPLHFPVPEEQETNSDADVERVLRRTALLRELVELNEEEENQTCAEGRGIDQTDVEEAIPPSTREALYRGLLSVAHHYCLPNKPQCDECPIHHICCFYRNDLIAQAEARLTSLEPPLTHIDLFSGAGGFGQGFEQAGYCTLLAAELDEMTTRTYRFNHPSVPFANVLTVNLEQVELEQAREGLERWGELLAPGHIDVITAGIPCQGFSTAGYRARPNIEYDVLEDPRNHLYQVVIRWTEGLQPKYVVIENVPGMRSAGNATAEENILQTVQNAFEEIGYSAHFGVVNAADFGVAQNRQRLILIASHPQAIPVTVDELFEYHVDRTNLMGAIGDLPPVQVNAGAWYMPHNGRVIIGHKARYNNEDDLQIYEAMNPGERYLDFVERRPDIIKARQQSKRAVYSTKSFADKYHKLVPEKPSRTIVAHLKRDGNGYIHPEQVRSITPREAARLQGFNDEFIFLGSQGAQFVQIGNAVPPPLARAVAQLLAERCTQAPPPTEQPLRVPHQPLRVTHQPRTNRIPNTQSTKYAIRHTPYVIRHTSYAIRHTNFGEPDVST